MNNILSKTSLSALAIVFTIALTYASVELPVVINSFLQRAIDFPGYDSNHPINLDQTRTFLESNHIRLIGYGSVIVILALIILGFFTKKSGLASTGAILIFLPVFGHFSFNMFFLAGLGAMRVLWMPVLDISYDLLNSGDIVYIPYMVIVYLPALIGFNITNAVPYIIMGIGILVFLLGTQSWLIAKYNKTGVASNFIYRFSRHPQYLGWIIWSYGVLIYLIRNSTLINFKLTYGMPSSLPWLITSLIIICVALLEEIKMKKSYPEEYQNYRNRAPFLFPVPEFVTKAINLPVKLLLRKEKIETVKDVIGIFFIYLGIMISLSLLFNSLDFLPRSGLYGFPDNVVSYK